MEWNIKSRKNPFTCFLVYFISSLWLQTNTHHIVATESANLFLLPYIYIQARLHFFSLFLILAKEMKIYIE